MSIEFELKYAAPPEAQQAIRESLGDSFREFSMETTYYDTPGGDLSARRWTLRRRFENGASVCTLKTPAGEAGRGEWDCHCGRIEDAIPILCKLSNQEALSSLTKDGVVPVCGARFTRLAFTIRSGDAELELALDRGVLTGGSREIPLCEVEVELKSGPREEAVLYGKVLERKFGLVPEAKSKFRRALELAQEV